MKIEIITTGGTIDKIYFDKKSDFEIGEPQIQNILDSFDVAFEFSICQLMRKDSLDMSDADRSDIVECINRSESEHFIVTHGTDTMVLTAEALELGTQHKTVVLTGALNPAKFQGSDAIFNIGCAVGALQTVSQGIFIAMNGKIWRTGDVVKNREENRFQSIS